MPDILVMLSNPKPGREAEVIDWHQSRHVADIAALPNVLGAQFFSLEVPSEARWRFALVCDLQPGTGSSVLAEIRHRMNGPSMPGCDAVAGCDDVLGSPRDAWRPAQDRTADDASISPQRLIALGNALAGQDDVYNDWYDGRHLPDVLTIPGFVGAQRFEATTILPYRYLAVYAAQTEDPHGMIAELLRRAGTPEMPVSDSLDRVNIFMGLYEAVTLRHSRR